MFSGTVRFAHHGIVISKSQEDALQIIHFAPVQTGMVWTSRVRTDSLEAFLGDAKNISRLGLKYYANTIDVTPRIPGDASRVLYYSNDSLSGDEVVENALKLRFQKGDGGSYSLFNQNCEHLAVSCKIGTCRGFS